MLVWYLKKGRRKYPACRVVRPLRAMNCCGTSRPRCCTCSASRSGRGPAARPPCLATCWTSIGYSRGRLRRPGCTTSLLSTRRGRPAGPTLWGASTTRVRRNDGGSYIERVGEEQPVRRKRDDECVVSPQKHDTTLTLFTARHSNDFGSNVFHQHWARAAKYSGQTKKRHHIKTWLEGSSTHLTITKESKDVVTRHCLLSGKRKIC